MSSKTVSSEEASRNGDGLHLLNDVACTRCGCLCDDLQVTTDGVKVTAVSMPDDACSIAESWFLSQRGDVEGGAFIGADLVGMPEAFAEATRLLTSASAPLVYGLTHCSTDGQRAAVALADRIGAYLDVPTSPAGAAALSAFQNAGASTCTLGEVRERADLIIYWGCDPVATHPRHLSRFVNASGRWTQDGRASRHVVSIGSDTGDSSFADKTVDVAKGQDAELISKLRAMTVENDDVAEVAGVPGDVVGDLAARMKGCDYGVIFYGEGIVENATDAYTVESLHRLAAELNAHARFTVRYMPGVGNATGAANVLTWQTGFPGNVDLTAGYPRYQPDECSAETLLAQNAVDAALIVGEESTERLSETAVKRLCEIPVVLLTHVGVDLPVDSAVRFVTGTPGVHHSGTAYRMDEIPLPMQHLFASDLPADEDVLKSLAARISC